MPAEIKSKILKRLDEMEQKEGQLPSLVQFYRELLRLQSEARSRFAVPKPNLAESVISEQTVQGIPLLSFENLSLDWAQLKKLFQEIVRLAAKDSSDLPREVESLESIAPDAASLEQVAKVWYQSSSLAPIAATHGIDDELITFLVGATLKPFLSAYGEVLMPLVNQELWRRRYCPVCGGKPDLAFLDKERGARWLLCSRCDGEWLFQRLECPYCGTVNQKSLVYFSDDQGLYRLYVCDECQSYIKAIDLRQTESEVLLSLERVLTLDLDSQGQEKGYKAGWTLASIR